MIGLIRHAPQRLDGGEIRLRHRRLQSFFRRRIPPADARNDSYPADEPSGVMVRIALLPRNHQEGTPPLGVGQRNEQAAVFCRQRIEPDGRKMRHPGIDDDGVGRPVRAECKAVGRHDRRLWPSGGKVLAGSGGKGGVNLDGGDATGAADDLGEDGAVIAGAGSDMHDMGATVQFELVVHSSPKTGLPIVEPAPLVDPDQHVMIEVARVGILRRPVLADGHRAEDAPRPGFEEALPRHRREGIDDRAGAQLGREPQFFCVAMPGLLDRIWHLAAPALASDFVRGTRINPGRSA
jgi:hypothetical protein